MSNIKSNVKVVVKKELVLPKEITLREAYKVILKYCNNKRKAALKKHETGIADYGKNGELRIIFLRDLRQSTIEQAIGKKELPFLLVAEWLWRMQPIRTIKKEDVFDKRHVVKWGEVEFFCPDLYYNDRGMLAIKRKKKA